MKNIVPIILITMLTTPMTVMADMDRCVSCHGVDFEKKALGNSKIVKEMSEKEIKAAIDGYKKGEGGDLKSIMIEEVNLGVDSDAMAADVYNEAHTQGFERPDDEFIFQKRLSVRTLHKIKMNIKKADAKKDLAKTISQIKSAAFTMYIYDDLLKKQVDFETIKANKSASDMSNILKQVTDIKVCIDHSFSKDEIVKCRVDFINLAGSLTYNEAKKMKAKMKKIPVYTGEGAVNIEKYLK
jgi:cytochrome c-type protein NapB